MMRAALVALLCVAGIASATRAQSPLERPITLHARNVSLRDALDRAASLARVHLSYSAENLPLERTVVVDRDSTALGVVLSALLAGIPVQPVVVGDNDVVLAPRARDTTAKAAPVPLLERVVVTGSAGGGAERPLPVAIDVVQGRDVQGRHETSLDEILDGSVPGMWVWQQTPTSLAAQYASIRGASSFGVSTPKVYIDGVELANPLLLTQITPEIVDRIEVIRGPQGAALYGADAISGVVNIVSRHDGADADGTHGQIRSDAGFTTSSFVPGAIPVQAHALTIRSGSALRSAGLNVGVSTTGEYIPRAFRRELRTTGDARLIGSRSTLTFNGRFTATNAGVPDNPLLHGLEPEELQADSQPQRLRAYSLGSALSFAASPRWTYGLNAGIDGYSLDNAVNELSPIPSAADTALRDASGAANRGTLRATAVATTGASDDVASTLTFAAEGSALRDQTLAQRPTLEDSHGQQSRTTGSLSSWTTNAGISAQENLAVRDALFLTGGLRLERIDQTVGASQSAALPMVGAAYVKDFPAFTLKLRSAYGRGIRAAHSTELVMHESHRSMMNPALEPESQSGVEGGADLYFASLVSLHVTGFDQLASNLVQSVTIVDTSQSGGGSGGPGQGRYWYQQQNVGAITNRGWEAQASLTWNTFMLGTAATYVDSRVQRVNPGYTGDLQPGDRMLAVPARTVSGTITWSLRNLTLSSGVSRASDWINYDRLAIAETIIANNGDATNLTGANLRTYWRSYTGSTRLRASAALSAWRGLVLTLSGDNLLNYQRGEPDTITITPGRTVMVGVRARF